MWSTKYFFERKWETERLDVGKLEKKSILVSPQEAEHNLTGNQISKLGEKCSQVCFRYCTETCKKESAHVFVANFVRAPVPGKYKKMQQTDEETRRNAKSGVSLGRPCPILDQTSCAYDEKKTIRDNWIQKFWGISEETLASGNLKHNGPSRTWFHLRDGSILLALRNFHLCWVCVAFSSRHRTTSIALQFFFTRAKCVPEHVRMSTRKRTHVRFRVWVSLQGWTNDSYNSRCEEMTTPKLLSAIFTTFGWNWHLNIMSDNISSFQCELTQSCGYESYTCCWHGLECDCQYWVSQSYIL